MSGPVPLFRHAVTQDDEFPASIDGISRTDGSSLQRFVSIGLVDALKLVSK